MFFKSMLFLPILCLSISCKSSQEIPQANPSLDRLITLEQPDLKSFGNTNLFFTVSECQSKEKKTCKILGTTYLSTLKESIQAVDLEHNMALINRHQNEFLYLREHDPAVKKLKREIEQLNSETPKNRTKIEQLENELQKKQYSLPMPNSYLDEKAGIIFTQRDDVAKLISKIESSKDGLFESELSTMEKAALERIVKLVEFLNY